MSILVNRLMKSWPPHSETLIVATLKALSPYIDYKTLEVEAGLRLGLCTSISVVIVLYSSHAGYLSHC